MLELVLPSAEIGGAAAGAAAVHELCRELGLFSQQYGRGRGTVLCVAREALPQYRADLDEACVIVCVTGQGGVTRRTRWRPPEEEVWRGRTAMCDGVERDACGTTVARKQRCR